jgi:hypothetical protein
MAKLKEILQHKKRGDEWFSYLAPEEYHTWEYGKPWDFNKFRNYGVALLAVSVSASEDVPGTKNIQRFSSKSPMYLETSGVELTEGHIGTKVKRMGSTKFRTDSVIELNQILSEFSEKSNIHFWWVSAIEVSNKKTGGICQFQRHNPDGHGVSLFFYRLKTGNASSLYPDISLHDQQLFLGKFKQYMARCVCDEKKQKSHGCALDKSAHRIIK